MNLAQLSLIPIELNSFLSKVTVYCITERTNAMTWQNVNRNLGKNLLCGDRLSFSRLSLSLSLSPPNRRCTLFEILDGFFLTEQKSNGEWKRGQLCKH